MSERVMSEATEAGARAAEMEQEITTGDLLAALADLGKRVNALADQLERAAEANADLDRRLSGLEQVVVTVQHAAELTSLRVTDLHAAIAEGDLPASRVGRRVVVLTTDLREWVENHKLAPIDREAS